MATESGAAGAQRRRDLGDSDSRARHVPPDQSRGGSDGGIAGDGRAIKAAFACLTAISGLETRFA